MNKGINKKVSHKYDLGDNLWTIPRDASGNIDFGVSLGSISTQNPETPVFQSANNSNTAYALAGSALQSLAGPNTSLVGNLANTASGLLYAVNPAIGLAASAVGAGANALFGQNINTSAIKEASNQISSIGNDIQSAGTYEQLAQAYNTGFNPTDVDYGTQGFAREWWGKLTGANTIDKEKERLRNQYNNTLAQTSAQAANNINLDWSRNAMANTLKNGGKIHIKPENRGKFTASAKRAGMGVQEFASHVLANKEDYSPLMRKRANFARNASHWNAEGGPNSLITWRQPIPSVLTPITPNSTYNDGHFGGAGASTVFYPTTMFNDSIVNDTILVPYERTFNEAFKEANSLGLDTFEFNGKKYNTTYSSNPNWKEAGNARVEQGIIPIITERTVKVRKKANGGALTESSTDFTNGVTSINNGDTHEMNPYGGVQMGIAPDGIPNQVEEGEVVYNDYVYSNRLKVPKAVREKYKLRGVTFAEVFKNAQKESAERPNDPISKNYLNNIAQVLADAQEELKASKASKSTSRQYDEGGGLSGLGLAPLGVNLGANISNLFGWTNKPVTYDQVTPYSPISTPTIGTYVTPTLMDRNWATNQALASAAATRRAISNTASPATAANLLGADYIAGNQLGNLIYQGQLQNANQQLAAAQFNRDVAKANAELGLQTASMNARQQLATQEALQRQALANVQEREKVGQNRYNVAMAAAEDLQGLAKQQDALNFRNALAMMNYWGKLTPEARKLLGLELEKE